MQFQRSVSSNLSFNKKYSIDAVKTLELAELIMRAIAEKWKKSVSEQNRNSNKVVILQGLAVQSKDKD